MYFQTLTKFRIKTTGTPFPRDDITFLKCLRLLMAMSKRRYRTHLSHKIAPVDFKNRNFQHHCNPNFDPPFNFGLIIRTSKEAKKSDWL